MAADAGLRLTRCAFGSLYSCGSIGEGPQPNFFLSDLPQPREAMGLDDQEENDRTAKDDELQIRQGVAGQRALAESRS